MGFNAKALARRHGSKLAIAAVAATVSAVAFGGVAFSTTPAAPAAAKTFSLTVSGTEAHSLDARVHPQFVNGGGVTPVVENGLPANGVFYFEIPLDLPVGAKVVSVAVTHANTSGIPTTAVFGSYSPTTLATQQNATLSLGGNTGAQKTVTKTGAPITTTVAGRRYAIDYGIATLQAYPGTNSTIFYGATIKYTCTSPCVP